MTVALFDITNPSPAPFEFLDMPEAPRQGELIQLPLKRWKIQSPPTWTQQGGEWLLRLQVAPDVKRV
jgi:hypothetical protein